MSSYVMIDGLGYYICAAPFAEGGEQNIKPAIESDLTSPSGMRKPRWVNNSWIDEEAEQLSDDLRAQAAENIEHTIDKHICATAQAKGYNSTESCLSYIGDANQQWDAEATAFKAWRSQCWEYVIAEQSKINTGTRTMPTPEEAVAELPAMIWP